MVSRSRLLLSLPVAAALALTGCGANPDGGGEGGEGGGGEELSVVASFYPLAYTAERVGGDHVEVTNLTKPGVEPHDLELTPRDVGTLSNADLVLYLREFQPVVDDAVASEASGRAFDVHDSARLGLDSSSPDGSSAAEVTAAGQDGGDQHADGQHPDDEHAGDETHGGADHDHGSTSGANDPHFWLDPTRLADVADAVAEQLADLDPENAQAYLANSDALREELLALDAEFQDALADCSNTELVTSHTAFGYLADRYGFEQVGIHGLSPEGEPTPQDLAEVTTFVREHDVSTIYYETLVNPAVAQTVADETGASTAVLDPLEGLTDASAGDDYLEVMRANLVALQKGQECG